MYDVVFVLQILPCNYNLLFLACSCVKEALQADEGIGQET